MEINISYFQKCIQILLDFGELRACNEEVLNNFLRLSKYTINDISKLLSFLGTKLLDPEYTEKIGVVFEKYLLLIVSTTISCDDPHDNIENYDLYQRECIALAKLMLLSKDVKRYSLKFFEKRPAPFTHIEYISPHKKTKIEKYDNAKNSLAILKCCYQLLRSDPEFFKEIWDWSSFVTEKPQDQYKDPLLQLYYNHTVAILADMSLVQLKKMNANIPSETFLQFDYEENFTSNLRARLKPSFEDNTTLSLNLPNDTVVNVEGVLLPIYNNKNRKFYEETSDHYDNIVKVESTQTNLRSIALGISSGKAVCLTGPVGCGKTTLVEYLARKTGRINPKQTEVLNSQLKDKENSSDLEKLSKHEIGSKRKNIQEQAFTNENFSRKQTNEKNSFLRIQLGDQTDGKMLLGQYSCTEVPGEFIWIPGVLTQAVINGYWLLLEDLDSATQDTFTILGSLFENNYLSVPGFRDCVKIAPGFQLFATMRTNKTSNTSQKLLYSLLEKYLYSINILPLSRSELCKVVSINYPKLSTVSNRIVDVFLTFSKGDHTFADNLKNHENENIVDMEKYTALPCEEISLNRARSNGDRLVSTRDLIKLCQRSNPSFSVTSAECAYFVFQNAVDVFCSHLTHGKEKTGLITSIGAKLGIIQSRCEYFSNEYKPDVRLDRECIKVGRCELFAKGIFNDTSEVFTDNRTKKLKLSNNTEVCNAPPNELMVMQSATFAFTRVASCILERIAVCVSHNEPVLLVGETGVGKTSSVQYLAERTHHKLTVINMNNQSDVSDLIGGFKPVDFKIVVAPLRCEFEQLFRKTFNQSKNELFLNKFSICYNQGNFSVLIKLMITVIDSVMKKTIKDNENFLRWKQLYMKLLKMDSQLAKLVNISFAFIAGPLVNCIQNGEWILLDEINLASAETLECLSTILEPDGSIVLLEKGDIVPVKRHPAFRIFACMNPSTDIGKKDLPIGIRNRFTEFFVDELTTDGDLTLLVNDYLRNTGIDTRRVTNIVKCYKKLKQMSHLELNDGLGNRPVFSLRTLCRSLRICAKNLCGSIERNLYESFCVSFLTQLDSISHAIVLDLLNKTMLSNSKMVLSREIPKPCENCINFEGYWIQQGEKELMECESYILTDSVRSNLKDLARIISIGKLPILLQGPTSAGKTSLIEYIAKKSGNHCLRINNHEHTDLQEYIGTYMSDENGKLSFKEGVLVQAMRNGFWIILDELNLASTEILEALNRVLDDNRELFIPETQVVVKAHPNFMLFATQNPPGLYGGRKTLSRAFKNRFIELHFSEIPRNELEVILEKRCFIPASYSKKMVQCMWQLQKNRKTTSKNVFTLRDLFRWGNRYTYADKKLLEDGKYDWNQHLVEEGYLVLSAKVRTSIEIEIIEDTLFANFRKRIDTNQLFGVSQESGSPVTGHIIKKIQTFKHRSDIVWTFNMTRMAVLTAKALEFNEPVLLVGPTGCGKTTICQILASIHKSRLRILNCHMHTEGADFLGGLRPCRKETESTKLFEWADGPLVISMQEGSYFMADEISLAEDSVLERLNCILEPERTLLLAEKGGVNSTEMCTDFIVKAHDGFQFLATMNPGGDFGKKELSPALRNRFTEIWCIPSNSREDLIQIAKNSMDLNWKTEATDRISKIAEFFVDVVFFIQNSVEKFTFSIRDILAWAHYLAVNSHLEFPEACLFGLETIFLDSLDMLPHESIAEVETVKKAIIQFAITKAKTTLDMEFIIDLIDQHRGDMVEVSENLFGIKPFYIKASNMSPITNANNFFFDSPTTKKNLFRILSALTLKKPVLLEGPPGVGKTSIVENIASAIGVNIVRINLCEHTDLADLFGTDLPAVIAEGEDDERDSTTIGSFEWRDGPLLAALKTENTWILLDELNLAPQAVLEGLNAILDHRGEVYIPELNKTFTLTERTRIFACQNPLRQGGGRKGLPQSFLNRFTKVYLRKLTTDDLLFVINSKYSSFFEKIQNFFKDKFAGLHLHSQHGNNLFEIFKKPSLLENIDGPDYCDKVLNIEFDLAERMVKFSEILDKGIRNLEFGCKGGPFEINLRDIIRWCDLLQHPETGFFFKHTSNEQYLGIQGACEVFEQFILTLFERMKVVYYQRMRSNEDKSFILAAFGNAFDCDSQKFKTISEDVSLYWTDSNIYLNDIVLPREPSHFSIKRKDGPLLLSTQRELIKNMIECVHMDKPILLCGPTDSGKTKLIDMLCTLSNVECNTDTIDDSVTGSFQQIDLNRHLEEVSERVKRIYILFIQNIILERTAVNSAKDLMKTWSEYLELTRSNLNVTGITEELATFRNRINLLNNFIQKLLSTRTGTVTTQNVTREVLEKQHRILCNLKHTTRIAESLNTGGSFEWVDSKIVKSLKDGQYISLEHVNLCSSAVLDRLNPVFEPNGQLLISEKGVTANDVAEIVHKHTNFRAFLTTDPKNGELSRAMRNRCVEIALTKDYYDEDDFRMIVYKNGVYDTSVMNIIIRIHNRICKSTEINHFSVSHLAHFSLLVAAYTHIGYENEKAVYVSGMEVYVYPSKTDLMGYGLEFYQNKLQEIVSEESKNVPKIFGNDRYENVFLSCNNLTTIALVKLQAEPLKVLLENDCNQMEVLTNLFSGLSVLNISAIDESNLRKHFIYMLYECSSLEDLKLRYVYLKNLLKNSDDLSQLNDVLYKVIEDFKNNFLTKLNGLPWNTKLFSRIRDYAKQIPTHSCHEFRLSSLLVSELLLNKVFAGKITKLAHISAFAYSQAVSEQLVNDNINNLFLQNLFTFTKNLRNVICGTFQIAKLEIQTYNQIITALLWFNRFLKTAQQQLFADKEVKTDLINELVLHFKWLDKHLLKLLEKVMPDFQQINPDFESCLQKIRSYEIKINHPLNFLRKMYGKQMLQFHPLYSEQQICHFLAKSKLNEALSLIPVCGSYESSTIRKKFLAQTSEESKHCRDILLKCTHIYEFRCSQVLGESNNIPTNIREAIQQYLKQMISDNIADYQVENHDFKDLTCRIDSIVNEIHTQAESNVMPIRLEIEVLPIREYYAAKSFTALLTKNDSRCTEWNFLFYKNIPSLNYGTLELSYLLQNTKIKTFLKMWTALVEYFAEMEQPSEFEELLQYLSGNYSSLSTFSRLLSNSIQMAQLFNLSAHNDICYTFNENIQDKHSNNLTYSGPPLTDTVIKFLFQYNGNLKPVPLKDINLWKKSLCNIQELLWNNSAITTNTFDVLQNNCKWSLISAKKLIFEVEYIQKICHNIENENYTDYGENFQKLINNLKKQCVKNSTYSANGMNNILMEKKILFSTAVINSLIGSIELCLLTYMPFIDPVKKNRLKNTYIAEDIDCLNTFLIVFDFMKIIMKYKNFGAQIYSRIEENLTRLEKKKQKFAHKVALRPKICLYSKLGQDVNHFMQTNCDPLALGTLIEKCEEHWEKMTNWEYSSESPQLQKTTEILSKLELWIVNSQRFKNHTLRKYKAHYADFVRAISYSVDMVRFGFEGLKKSFVHIQNAYIENWTGKFVNLSNTGILSNILENIIDFPSTSDLNIFDLKLPTTDLFKSKSIILSLLDKLEGSEIDYLRLLKVKVTEICNRAAISLEITEETFHEIDYSCRLYNKIWQQEEEKKFLQKSEEESLYKFQNKCQSEDEEIIELQEIENIFPTNVHEDFGEFIFENALEKIVNRSDKLKGSKIPQLISPDDCTFLANSFIALMTKYSKFFYNQSTNKIVECPLNFVDTFKERIKVFVRLFSEYKTCLSEKIDFKIYNALKFAVDLQKRNLKEVSFEGKASHRYNFYKDSNIPEVILCLDILNKLEIRVQEQLEFYPEHATLNDIQQVIQRIRNLPSNAPVVRFNTGFQILRQKVAQWNEVAHRKNNFRNEENKIAEYVQNWTKLELQFWRNCLSEIYEKVESNAHKYWFFIYNLIQEFIENNEVDNSLTDIKLIENRFSKREVIDNLKERKFDKVSVRDIIRVLRQFIESANYGDFDVRIKLLQSFEVYLDNVRIWNEKTNCKNIDYLIAGIHNLQIYFTQFTAEINEIKKSIRSPIEKKLREFVKIESYNKDLSYFSMKSNVTRVHRNLNKFLREYQVQLEEKIIKVLQPKESIYKDYNVVNCDEDSFSFKINANIFIAPTKPIAINSEIKYDEGLLLLHKVDKLFNTARDIVKKTITNISYPIMIETMEDIFSNQIDTCQYLRNLIVDRSVERKKQVIEAKQILQQKRKALSDWFKILTHLGLSYKTGLMEMSLRTEFEDLSIKSFIIPSLVEEKNISNQICNWSQQTDMYYVKSIFKLKIMQNAMLSPPSELGPPNIDRIKGFSVDAFLLVQEQRKLLANSSNEIIQLQDILENIKQLTKINDEIIKADELSSQTQHFSLLRNEFVAIKMSICKIRWVFEQFVLLIACIPEYDSIENRVFGETRNVILQGDEKFLFVSASSREVLASAKKILTNVNEMYKTQEFLSAVSISELHLEHDKLIKQVNTIRDCFKLADSHNEYLPIAKPLTDLLSFVDEIFGKSFISNCDQEEEVENLDVELESILHSVLMSLQKLFKKYYATVDGKQNNSNDIETEETGQELQQNHLRVRLYDEISADWNVLNLSHVISATRKVLLAIKNSVNLSHRNISISKVITILPLLKQYKLLADYYLYQQLGSHYVSVKMLSTMLTVFVELSLKGFCVPADLMQDEKGKQKQDQVKEGENFGLEDGTGEKNVSDQIESEDQLDDAKRPQDRENEEKKDDDCKEDTGIEMSEDFEGKLQDLDKPEDDEDKDEDEKSEDETDLNKEMGETEEGAEKLDDQIWGDDEEHEEGEDDEKNLNEEDEGKGSKDETDAHNDLDSKMDSENAEHDKNEKDGLDATAEQSSDNDKRKQETKDIDKMQDPEIDEDQINPYHNELEEPPQPEDMDLGDLNTNEGQQDDEDEQAEDDNPLDIDKMKDNMEITNEEERNEKVEEEIENEKQDASADESESEAEMGEKSDEKQNTNNDSNDEQKNDDTVDNDDITSNAQEDAKEEENDSTADEPKKNDSPEEQVNSKDKPSDEDNVQSVPETSNDCSADQVENQEKDKNVKQEQNLDEQDTGEDKDGVGQAENETTGDGHQGIAETKEAITKEDRKNDKITKEKRKQGRTNESRTLGEAEKQKLKQLKTVENINEQENEVEERTEDDENPEVESEEYQHVKNPKNSDKVTLDNATEEQSKKLQHRDDEEQKDEVQDDDAEEQMDVDEATDEKIEDLQKVPEMISEKNDKKSSDKNLKADNSNKEQQLDSIAELDVEGENIETLTVSRGDETFAHCSKEIAMDTNVNPAEDELNAAETLEIRKMYQKQVTTRESRLPQHEDYDVWQTISNRMSENARELCEQLRLILEPTKCTRLKGDYRTGRRINMKKIIPYIASQFRKDKIWLRRTKPAKRDYKITIAIDDSKSMHHNNSKNLTLEAISLVSQALQLLESGHLSIVSFGESPKIILNHTEQFDGPKLIDSLNFSQNKTKIAELLNFIRIINIEEANLGSDNGLFENLVLILSDGRNIFSEGKTKVKNAIKLARLQRIFLVYIIIDNPENKNSILDIQSMEVLPDKKFSIKPYLDEFPFPYYVIVRDLNQLPLVLSEAMRQWFEIVNSEQ